MLKLGRNRSGDAAEMALVGLVEDEIVSDSAPKAKKAEDKKVDMVAGEAKA